MLHMSEIMLYKLVRALIGESSGAPKDVGS